MLLKSLLVIFLVSSSGAFGSEYSRSELEQIVADAEKKHGLPSGMLHAIVMVESNYTIRALNPASRKGTAITSYGIGQLTLATARHHCKLSEQEIYDPKKNIDCSAIVLKYQLERHHHAIDNAVAAYNAGTPCRCNGEIFVKWLYIKSERSYGDVPCQRYIKKDGHKVLIPISCSIFGEFLNQHYVDRFRSFWSSNSKYAPIIALASKKPSDGRDSAETGAN